MIIVFVLHGSKDSASVVWSPYVKADISRIEMVQRKAARFVFNDFSS